MKKSLKESVASEIKEEIEFSDDIIENEFETLS
jgi:hypothetical protein